MPTTYDESDYAAHRSTMVHLATAGRPRRQGGSKLNLMAAASPSRSWSPDVQAHQSSTRKMLDSRGSRMTPTRHQDLGDQGVASRRAIGARHSKPTRCFQGTQASHSC